MDVEERGENTYLYAKTNVPTLKGDQYIKNPSPESDDEEEEINILDERADKISFILFLVGFIGGNFILWAIACIMYVRSQSKKARKFGYLSGYFTIFGFTFWVLLVEWVILPLVAMRQ
ncbi:hypothetical protein ABK040_011503 [Willaertia magna]